MISALELGRRNRNTSYALVNDIATALAVSPRWLCGESDPAEAS